jgi:hypothetical protein
VTGSAVSLHYSGVADRLVDGSLVRQEGERHAHDIYLPDLGGMIDSLYSCVSFSGLGLHPFLLTSLTCVVVPVVAFAPSNALAMYICALGKTCKMVCAMCVP